jgi:RNA polymerase subunit RPABC4/transcription elongation factor Spt4
MNEKEVVCLKCKKIFMSEIDSKGIPYSKICPNCKKKNTKNFGRGISGTI